MTSPRAVVPVCSLSTSLSGSVRAGPSLCFPTAEPACEQAQRCYPWCTRDQVRWHSTVSELFISIYFSLVISFLEVGWSLCDGEIRTSERVLSDLCRPCPLSSPPPRVLPPCPPLPVFTLHLPYVSPYIQSISQHS